jgi:hypothetical protein
MGGFNADPGALRARAADFLTQSDQVARLVGQLGGAGRASTGDGGLDGRIAGLVEQIRTSAAGCGMAMEGASEGLLVNAQNYESADLLSMIQPGP